MGLFSSLGGLLSFVPGLGPVAGAIGGAIGGAIDSNNSASDARQAQSSTNAYNSAEAQKTRDWANDQRLEVQDFNSAQVVANRDFQERMANTAYQRGVKDMQAAGLNPMLAYSQGGASAPQGNTASSSAGSGATASAQNMHPAAVAAAASAATVNSQIEVQKAQAANLRADAALKDAQVPYTEQLQTTSAADAQLKGSQAQLANETVRKISHEVQNIDTDNILKRNSGNTQLALAEVYRNTLGKINAETDKLRADEATQRQVAAKIMAEIPNIRALLPGLVAKESSDLTTWGQKVRPYLNDAKTISDTASAIFKIIPQLSHLIK